MERQSTISTCGGVRTTSRGSSFSWAGSRWQPGSVTRWRGRPTAPSWPSSPPLSSLPMRFAVGGRAGSLASRARILRDRVPAQRDGGRSGTRRSPHAGQPHGVAAGHCARRSHRSGIQEQPQARAAVTRRSGLSRSASCTAPSARRRCCRGSGSSSRRCDGRRGAGPPARSSPWPTR